MDSTTLSPPTRMEPTSPDNKENQTLPFSTPFSSVSALNKAAKIHAPATPVSMDLDSTVRGPPNNELKDDVEIEPETFIFRGEINVFIGHCGGVNGAVLCTPLLTVLLDGLGAGSNVWPFLKNLKNVDVAIMTSFGGQQTAGYEEWMREHPVSPALTCVIEASSCPTLVERTNMINFKNMGVHAETLQRFSGDAQGKVMNLAHQIRVGSLDVVNCGSGENGAVLLMWTPADPSAPIRRILFTSNSDEISLLSGIHFFFTSGLSVCEMFSQCAMTGNILEDFLKKRHPVARPPEVLLKSRARPDDAPLKVRKLPEVILSHQTKSTSSNPHEFKLTRERSVLRRPMSHQTALTAKPTPGPAKPGQDKKVETPKRHTVPMVPASKPVEKRPAGIRAPVPVDQSNRRASSRSAAFNKNIQPSTSAAQPPPAEKSSGGPVAKNHSKSLWVDVAFVPHNGVAYQVTDRFFETVRAKNYIFQCAEISPENALNAFVAGKAGWMAEPCAAILAYPAEITDELRQRLTESSIVLEQFGPEPTMEIPTTPPCRISGAQIVF